MTMMTCDVIVLGSGFGGSLLSTLLAKSGRSVVMLDRGQHPRFAIGESSTPLADTTLRLLAEEFDVPELRQLSQYGTWKQSHPDVTCGLKRGFSYFGHDGSGRFSPTDQLLVAASPSDHHADTHWLRSDVDGWFFRLAQQQGVRVFQNVTYRLQPQDRGWQVCGTSDDQSINLTGEFVIDATGGSSAVLQTLQVADRTEWLTTYSHAIFGHFCGVRPVVDVLQELHVDCGRHPFACDAAAVHHVLNDGWMWQLRFDDNSVSAGVAFDPRRSARLSDGRSVQQEWKRRIDGFEFLRLQFRDAQVIRPDRGLQQTGRLQRLAAAAAGTTWAALPSTVGFVDPLHSTGIAHTLFGVHRLARILTSDVSKSARTGVLAEYSRQVIEEIRLVDDLVEGCYAALPNFRLFSAWCMLYFAAVTSMEQAKSDIEGVPAFLRADDVAFRAMLVAARQKLQAAIDGGGDSNNGTQFEQWLRTAIEPWNCVGLLDPDANGMYAGTAAG
ncbi:MAG: tryptophan 7-halogenase [Planctomycetaceae bacterium]